MSVDKRISYTAADSIPLKILMDIDILKSVKNKRIPPVHIQFIPTNRCNLNCNFCSCSERTKNEEMDFELAKKIINKCKSLGTKAVTITGGGEPLLYKNFNELIEYFRKYDIKIGLVTNGLLLHKVDPKILNKITWCRISNGDDRTFTPEYKTNLSKVVLECSDVDWAFSYVVSSSPNLKEIERIIEFANLYDFTHVRLVADLFQPDEIDMEAIKYHLKSQKILDERVIYQERKEFTTGKDCYICYLKPLIGADGKVYGCCGVQYALSNPSMDLPKELCLGNALDLGKIIEKSNKPFAAGNLCVKCYYSNYNTILKGLLSELDHKEFV